MTRAHLAHLLLTDLRRFRLALGLFVALVLMGTTLEIVRPVAAGASSVRAALGVASTVIWAAKLLLAGVVASMVVHADPLVGSDAFWMTRPIPPRILMASKLALLAAVIAGVPALGDVLVMAAHQVPASTQAGMLVQEGLRRTLWLALLMAGASVTRTLAGFGMLCGAALVTVAIAFTASAAIMLARLDDGPGVGFVSIGVSPVGLAEPGSTSGVVLILLIIASALALVAVQHQVRLRSRSIPTGIAGAALAIGIASIWPWPVLDARLPVPQWAHGDGTLRLTADPDSVDFAREGWALGEQNWRLGRARMTVSDVPAGWSATFRLVRGSLALADGGRLETRQIGFTEPVPLAPGHESQQESIVRRLLGIETLGGFWSDALPRPVLLVLSTSEFQANRNKIGVYTGAFVVDLNREEIAASLPLEPGARYQEGPYRFIIDEVSAAEGLSLRIRQSGASPIFARAAPLTYSYYFRNRRLNEAVSTWTRSLLAEAGSFGLFGVHAGQGHGGAGFGFYSEAVLVSPQRTRPQKSDVPIDEQWIADGELVIVRTTRQGSVIRSVEISEFRVQELPASQQSPPALSSSVSQTPARALP